MMLRPITSYVRLPIWPVIAVSLTVFACTQGAPAEQLGSADLNAIRSASLAYPAAWLTNQPGQVRATLTEDAVLMPSGGMEPLVGMPAINEFFWPADAPPMEVTEFVMEPAEIAGTKSLAYVRGHMELTFETESNEALETYTTQGTYLMILRPSTDRSWRISRYTWNHPPWELIASDPLPSREQ